MVWTPPSNERQSLAKEDLPVDIAQQEDKRKTATIMEELSDGLHDKQKRGRRYDVQKWMDIIQLFNLKIDNKLR